MAVPLPHRVAGGVGAELLGPGGEAACVPGHCKALLLPRWTWGSIKVALSTGLLQLHLLKSAPQPPGTPPTLSFPPQ